MRKPPKRIGDIPIPGTGLTLLRHMAKGDRLTGARVFPHEWTFTQTPALAAERSAKAVSASLVDTLARTGLIARGEAYSVKSGPAWNIRVDESCAFSLTDKGRLAIAGNGFDPVPEQPELFPAS